MPCCLLIRRHVWLQTYEYTAHRTACVFGTYPPLCSFTMIRLNVHFGNVEWLHYRSSSCRKSEQKGNVSLALYIVLVFTGTTSIADADDNKTHHVGLPITTKRFGLSNISRINYDSHTALDAKSKVFCLIWFSCCSFVHSSARHVGGGDKRK